MTILYIKGCIPTPGIENLTRDENFGGKTFEAWSINDCSKVGARHFQLHGLRHMRERHGTDYFLWLSALEVPVYFFPEQLEAWPSRMSEFGLHGLPRPMAAAEFPAAKLCDRYGRYFTGSFPWLIAFAMLRHEAYEERLEEIRLVGVEFPQTRLWAARRYGAALVRWFSAGEPDGTMPPRPPTAESHVYPQIVDELEGVGSGDESWAVPCIEHRLGLARGLGIRCAVEPASGIFFNKWGEDVLYGLTGGGNE